LGPQRTDPPNHFSKEYRRQPITAEAKLEKKNAGCTPALANIGPKILELLTENRKLKTVL
jgi:hypothetical protein